MSCLNEQNVVLFVSSESFCLKYFDQMMAESNLIRIFRSDQKHCSFYSMIILRIKLRWLWNYYQWIEESKRVEKGQVQVSVGILYPSDLYAKVCDQESFEAFVKFWIP